LGPVAVQAERAQRINVPAWAGAALAGCGGPLLLAQMQARPLSVRAVTVDTLRPGLADAHAAPASR